MNFAKSSDDLKRIINSNVQGLSMALSNNDHLFATCLIRDFVSNIFIFSDTMPTNENSKCINEYEVHLVYNLLIAKKIDAVCGGISSFLARIYNLYGYEACCYDYGIVSTKATHVITLVKFPDDKKFYIQDATFRATYYVNEGNGSKLCDFVKLMQLIYFKRSSNIHIVRSSNILFATKNDKNDEYGYVVTASNNVVDKYMNMKNSFAFDYVAKKITAKLAKKDITHISLLDLFIIPVGLYSYKYIVDIQDLYYQILKNSHLVKNINKYVNKEIIIFGAGIIGLHIHNFLKEFSKPICFIDNDIQKQSCFINGLKVLSPEVIYEYKNAIIVLASEKKSEMMSQLIDVMNVNNKIVSYNDMYKMTMC